MLGSMGMQGAVQVMHTTIPMEVPPSMGETTSYLHEVLSIVFAQFAAGWKHGASQVMSLPARRHGRGAGTIGAGGLQEGTAGPGRGSPGSLAASWRLSWRNVCPTKLGAPALQCSLRRTAAPRSTCSPALRPGWTAQHRAALPRQQQRASMQRPGLCRGCKGGVANG
jgi:hypothetical protein